MRKYTKAGLLMLTLVFPVLIYLFLKVFTTNRFDLPYYIPLRDAANNAIVQPDGDTTFYQVQDFSFLTDSEAISVGSLEGKTILVSTLSSPCVDTCQEVIKQLVRIQALHKDYPQFIILTLVSAGDEQLISMINERRQSDAGWLVAALPDATLSRAIQNTFQLNEKVPGLQTISPQARLSLVDNAGFIRGFYDTTDTEEADRVMAEIRILEHNREDKK